MIPPISSDGRSVAGFFGQFSSFLRPVSFDEALEPAKSLNVVMIAQINTNGIWRKNDLSQVACN